MVWFLQFLNSISKIKDRYCDFCTTSTFPSHINSIQLISFPYISKDVVVGGWQSLSATFEYVCAKLYEVFHVIADFLLWSVESKSFKGKDTWADTYPSCWNYSLLWEKININKLPQDFNSHKVIRHMLWTLEDIFNTLG